MLLMSDCDKGVIRIYARKCGCVLIFQGSIFQQSQSAFVATGFILR